MSRFALTQGRPEPLAALREPGGTPVPDDVTLLVVPAEAPWGVRALRDVFLISTDVSSDEAVAASWLSQLRH